MESVKNVIDAIESCMWVSEGEGQLSSEDESSLKEHVISLKAKLDNAKLVTAVALWERVINLDPAPRFAEGADEALARISGDITRIQQDIKQVR